MAVMGAVASRARRRASGTLTLTKPGSSPGGWSSALAGSFPVSAQVAGWPAVPEAGTPLPGGAGLAAATASRAWADMDSTVWRQKECQVRTWCWSRPAWPFPCWKHSSTGHLFPATLIRTGSETGRPSGAWQ